MNNEKETPELHQVSAEDYELLQLIKNGEVYTVEKEEFEIIDKISQHDVYLDQASVEALAILQDRNPRIIADYLSFVFSLLERQVDEQFWEPNGQIMVNMLKLNEFLHLWYHAIMQQADEDYQERLSVGVLS